MIHLDIPNNRVGIGATSPSATTEIYKNTTSDNDKLLRIYNANGLQWEIQAMVI